LSKPSTGTSSGRSFDFRCDEFESPGNDREPSEQALLIRRKQVVTPLDRRTQTPLPLRQVTGATREKIEASTKAFEDPLRS